MEAVAQVLALLFMLVAFASGFFLFAVQPIWGIIDVAVCKRLSGGAKTAIILLTLLLLGPVMTFFYAPFGTRTPAFRKSTIVATITFVLSIACVLVMAALAPQPTTPAPIEDGVLVDAPADIAREEHVFVTE